MSFRTKSHLFFATVLVAFGLSGVANAQLNLVPNGDFETAAGANWVFAGGGSVISYPATGGNPGGYGAMDSSGGWGVLVSEVDTTNGLSLGSLGLTAGEEYTFCFDMIDLGGTSPMAGIKFEGWDGTSNVGDSGDIKFGATSAWTTFSPTWTIPASATSIKFVPLSVDGGNVGFDNVGVKVVPEPAAIGLIGLAGLALVGFIRRRK